MIDYSKCIKSTHQSLLSILDTKSIWKNSIARKDTAFFQVKV